jgi:hypothetical protein
MSERPASVTSLPTSMLSPRTSVSGMPSVRNLTAEVGSKMPPELDACVLRCAQIPPTHCTRLRKSAGYK